MIKQSINQVVLSQILADLNAGNIKRCESYGFSIEALQELQSLSLNELMYIGNSEVQLFSIRINHDTLIRLRNQARESEQSQKLIDRALFLGASIEILDKFFGLKTNEISARRRLLNLEIKLGRSRKVNEEESNDIWHQWQKYELDNLNSIHSLDVLMLITETLLTKYEDLTLTTVYTFIDEFLNDKQY